jgi:hypothetical protein
MEKPSSPGEQEEEVALMVYLDPRTLEESPRLVGHYRRLGSVIL